MIYQKSMNMISAQKARPGEGINGAKLISENINSEIYFGFNNYLF
jgi:hypothetical protein